MKAIIIYATKHGATKKIAEHIANRIGGTVLCDITENHPLCISDYDCVILGSPLTAGMIHKQIKQFAANHIEQLTSKRLGLFVSGLQKEGEATYLKQNFPPGLLDAARAKAFLGGIFDPAKCGFLARIGIKMAAKLNTYTSIIDEDEINAFVQLLLES